MVEISDYLQELEEQQVQEESEILVVQNPVVEELCEIYARFNSNRKSNDYLWDIYDTCLEIIEGKVITAKVVRDFSIILKKYEADRYFSSNGIFLSSLINYSEEKKFEIVTAHLVKEMGWIGCFNKKSLVVKGNAGFATGTRMEKGIIKIMGDAGKYIGGASEGGKIHVSGRIRSIGQDCEAKIYRKGKLIWPR